MVRSVWSGFLNWRNKRGTLVNVVFAFPSCVGSLFILWIKIERDMNFISWECSGTVLSCLTGPQCNANWPRWKSILYALVVRHYTITKGLVKCPTGSGNSRANLSWNMLSLYPFIFLCSYIDINPFVIPRK